MLMIEKTFDKYVVVEARAYSTQFLKSKVISRGQNLFGQDLGISEFTLVNHEIRYKCGEAVSSAMTYEKCKEYIELSGEIEYIGGVHSCQYVELDCRYFRK